VAYAVHHLTHEPGEYRSHLEQQIADELALHGIDATYELPVEWPPGVNPPYLPDFYIHPEQVAFNALSPDPLSLPRWIEAKPQPMIEHLRDRLGVTRRFGAFFDGTVDVPDVDAAMLRDKYEMSELWKPKRLAEIMGEPVWVVGIVGATNRLSATMLPDRILFHRDNWFVNWPGYKRRMEREEARQRAEIERAAWQERRDEYERQYEAQRAQQERDRAAQADAQWGIVRSHPIVGSNKFDKACFRCGVVVGLMCGNLRKVSQQGGGHVWVTTCHDCERRD
jgi:hypothetical protein